MNITKEFLIEEYLKKRRSSDGIALSLRVPRHKIRNTLFKFKISRRDFSPEGQKWCPQCEKYLFFQEFSFSKRNKNHLQDICRQCATIRARKYQPLITEKRRIKKAKLVLDFGNKCKDCGIEDIAIDAFVFHHHSEKMSSKNYWQPGEVISRKDEKLLQKERTKWILLCANCHCIRHGSGIKATKMKL